MGTSTRWPGPKGGAWSGPNRELTNLNRDRPAAGSTDRGREPGDDTADVDPATRGNLAAGIARRRWEALGQTLRDSPEAYGLQAASSSSGQRLLQVLERLASEGTAALGPFSGATEEARLADFVQSFTERVAGPGSSPAYSAVRQAAAQCAEQVLNNDPRIRRAVIQCDKTSGIVLSDELFCWIFRLFFAKVVAQFIQATIAAKINLLAPWWQAVDPAAKAAEWLTHHIMALLPNPCEKKRAGDDGGSLAELARDLLEETVKRSLDLPVGTPE